MTNEEFLKLLEIENFTPEAYHSEDYDDVNITKMTGGFEEVDSYGGEGKGDEYWKVLHFPQQGVYLRADGWYASHEGSNMDDAHWYIVVPKEETITVYEKPD